jgi:hypothetical protein
MLSVAGTTQADPVAYSRPIAGKSSRGDNWQFYFTETVSSHVYFKFELVNYESKMDICTILS